MTDTESESGAYAPWRFPLLPVVELVRPTILSAVEWVEHDLRPQHIRIPPCWFAHGWSLVRVITLQQWLHRLDAEERTTYEGVTSATAKAHEAAQWQALPQGLAGLVREWTDQLSNCGHERCVVPEPDGSMGDMPTPKVEQVITYWEQQWEATAKLRRGW